ncbi:MAG: hypothetical protein QOJ09_284 [Actinomycetota bacterium]|nr:hypothetical protein [Actinomycetota bacterium]
MGPAEYVAHLRADGGRLADVADGNLDARVPSCPEWNVADLVWHTGAVHRFWAEVVRTNAQAVAGPPALERPSAGALVDWFRDGLEQSAQTLEGADPATPIWTWTSTDDTAGWVQRRMAQETAVHRWDAEVASGQTTGVDHQLAVDGIDEFLDIFLPEADGARAFGTGTIHLHTTDGDGEWLLTVDGSDVRVERGHVKGDVAVRGPASDLLLMLWRRLPPDGLDVLGDGSVLDHFLAAVAID